MFLTFVLEDKMLLSLGLIIIVSLSLNSIFHKIKIPGLIAFILTGIILGPFVLNLIDQKILDISADLRTIALVIILLRAGLSLDLKDLKKVGLPAILLSFLPSTFELILFGVAAPLMFNIPLIEALILGAAAIAVSPAIIVPRMIQLIEDDQGTDKKIPQMILAGSSIEDIYIIVLFTVFLRIYDTNSVDFISVINVPVSLIAGILLGIGFGLLLNFIFKKFHMRDTLKVMVISGTSFLFVVLEQWTKNVFEISGLIAIVTLGATILETHPVVAKRLNLKFSKIWVGAEIMLFVLVGAIVDITQFTSIKFLLLAIAVVLLGLIVRSIVVFLSISNTNLHFKEKLFVCISYLPKATVQAAIGAIPYQMGIPSGDIILAISVLAIFISAPMGAIGIEQSGKKWLSRLA